MSVKLDMKKCEELAEVLNVLIELSGTTDQDIERVIAQHGATLALGSYIEDVRKAISDGAREASNPAERMVNQATFLSEIICFIPGVAKKAA